MIVASELTKRFRVRSEEILAVDRLSFTVGAGEVYGLLGPNGAGKTTTLRMVMGLLTPDSGFAEVGNIRTGTHAHLFRGNVGMISTNDGVYPWLTSREMLLYFGDLYGVPLLVARDRIAKLSELLGLERYLDQRCSTLSTGQRQRVVLARGLMHDPPVMLLDEPTRGLDVVGSRTIFQFISHLRESGKAVLVSTHRLDEAERLCNRFGLIYRGRMQLEGTLEQLQATTGLEHLVDMFVRLLDTPDSSSAPSIGLTAQGAAP